MVQSDKMDESNYDRLQTLAGRMLTIPVSRRRPTTRRTGIRFPGHAALSGDGLWCRGSKHHFHVLCTGPHENHLLLSGV